MTRSGHFSDLAAAVVTAAVFSACSSHDDAHPASPSALPAAAVASVDGDLVEADTVARIVLAQGITAKAARDEAVSDALLGRFAKDRYSGAVVRTAEVGARARALLEVLRAEARGKGPATDGEVAEATLRRWWELDRPPLLRTTHAVVVVKKTDDDKKARAVADRIAAAVEGATNPAAFRKAATSVPSAGFDVRVEDLDPVARDGRTVNPDSPPPPGSRTGEYASAYVDAAFAIPAVGGVSPVVRSEFGYHVILAVELLPERRTPVEERRRMLEPEIMDRRASILRDGILERGRGEVRVDVERSAVDLMEKVSIRQ